MAHQRRRRLTFMAQERDCLAIFSEADHARTVVGFGVVVTGRYPTALVVDEELVTQRSEREFETRHQIAVAVRDPVAGLIISSRVGVAFPSLKIYFQKIEPEVFIGIVIFIITFENNVLHEQRQ